MASLAVPSEAELTQLSKNDLVGVVQRAVAKLQSQRSRIRKLASSAKEVAKSGALELADYGSAALGGAGVGMMMGSIQAKIAAGEEGYDEESLLVFGVDKDLAAAIAGAAAAYAISRKADAKKADDPAHKYAHYVKMGAVGALASWAGRVAYEYALTPDEEQGGGQQAA